MVAVYLIAQAAALLAYRLVPSETWLNAIWQTVVMSASVAFMLVGVRRLRPEGELAWWLIGGGVLINGLGVVVEMVSRRYYGVHASPQAADAFWSSLFPAAALGLGLLVRRAVAREEPSVMARNTVICVPVIFFAGIYAWQFVAWRSYYAESVPLAYKIMVAAYPFGDFVFLALLLRLVLSVGLRNRTLQLLLLWLVLLLPSDLGWPLFVRAGRAPGTRIQYFMEATWMAGCAVLGLATWHRDVRALSRSENGRVPALGPLGWFGLLACILVGPLVVLFQVLLDRVYLLNTFWG